MKYATALNTLIILHKASRLLWEQISGFLLHWQQSNTNKTQTNKLLAAVT